MPKKKREKINLKHSLYHIIDIVLIALTAVAIILVFKNPFRQNIDIYINYSFLALLLFQFSLAHNKNEYLKQNIWDVIIITVLSTPLLRIFRLLRLFRALRAGLFIKRINAKKLKSIFRITHKNISMNLAFVILVVLMFAGIEYFVERGINSGFVSYKDAVWWAFSTITTVGYGDIAPMTSTGRLVAVGLMLTGIVICGILVSNLTAWLMEKD